jgi:hypothetical protein
MRPLVALVVLCAGLAAPATFAHTTSYSIAVPPDEPAFYEIPMRVSHAGPVIVDAVWKGARAFTFRLVRVGSGAPVVRRSGPSPQRIAVDVTPVELRPEGVVWTLEIRTPAARDPADGTVKISVPDAPEVVAAREEAAKPPAPPPPVPNPWTVARIEPPDASPRLAHVFARVEKLRDAVYGNDPFVFRDGCGWQDDLVRWAARQRDGLAGGAPATAAESLRYLGKLAHAVRAVDALRTSTSALIAGPVPQAPLRRRAWLVARRDAFRPIERELDALADEARRGRVPELSAENWPPRLIACLTSCERHFEARARVAPETAEGAEIAESQWPKILAAGAAFDALAAWLEDSAAP